MFKTEKICDITEEFCPYTIVVSKVAIDDIKKGEILEIKTAGGVPCRNVPLAMEVDGHKFLGKQENSDGTVSLFIEKGEL